MKMENFEAALGAPIVKTVIFDCGRVLTFDQDIARAKKMADFFGAEPEAFSDAYSAERGEYDRGTISAFQYWNAVGARFGVAVDEKELAKLIELDMDSWFNINPETVRTVRELKARGLELLMLSNMNVEGKLRLEGKNRALDGEDWISFFDEVILSCDVKMLKPDAEIFDYCLSRTRSKPGECLFIDDIPANIRGAESRGIRGVVFSDAARLRADLKNAYGLL